MTAIRWRLTATLGLLLAIAVANAEVDLVVTVDDAAKASADLLASRALIPSVTQYLGVERFIPHDGLKRWFLEHQPDNFQDNAALVIILHWGSGNMRSSNYVGRLKEKDPWLKLSSRDGFLVLAPNACRKRDYLSQLLGLETRGSHQNWSDILGGGPSSTGADDVGFIAALIDWAVAKRKIDPGKVYVTGMSNGGTMVYRLLVERPELFAGAAAFVANMPSRDVTPPSTPTPLFIMDATKDKRMPYDGNQAAKGRGLLRSAEATRDYFVAANNAGPDMVETELPDTDPNDNCRIWSQFFPAKLPGSSPVQFYKLDGGGHVAAGKEFALVEKFVLMKQLGQTCHDAFGIELAWSFMSQYTR